MSVLTAETFGRRLEMSACGGIVASLIAVLGGVSAGHAPTLGYAAITPQDVTAWVTAICSAIGAISAAANGLAILIHRWGKPPRKPRKKPPEPAPEEKS